MQSDTVHQLDDAAIAAKFSRGGTGVLSVAKDNLPYSIPVSFSHDARPHRFFFQLGFTAQSEKHEFILSGSTARLVTYDKNNGTWESVIATGTLSDISPDDLDMNIVANLREGQPPLFAIWDETVDAVDFKLFELTVSSISGRRITDTQQ